MAAQQARHQLGVHAYVPMLVVFTSESALRILAQLYLKTQGAPPIVISMATTLLWLGVLLGGLFWGRLSDKVSLRSLLLAVILGSALLLGALGLLLPTPAFLTIRFLHAFVMIGVAPAVMSIASTSTPIAQRGRVLSRIGFFRTIGMAIGRFSGGLLLAALAYRGTFLVLASLCLVALPVILAPRSECRVTRAPTHQFSGIYRQASLKRLYVGTLISQMGIFGSISLVFVYMATLGIREELMGALYALAPGTSMFGMLISGRLSDMTGRRAVFIAGFGLSALCPLLFAFASGIPMMAAGFVMMGISFGPLFVGSTAQITDLVPSKRHGTMLGVFESSRAMGGVIGPLVAGAIMPIVGYQTVFLVMAAISSLGLLLVIRR